MICVSPVRRKVRRGKPTENGLEFHFSTKKRFASQVRSQETSPGRKGGGWRRKKGEGGRRKQKKRWKQKEKSCPANTRNSPKSDLLCAFEAQETCQVTAKARNGQKSRERQRNATAKTQRSNVKARPQKTRQERDSRMLSGRTVKAQLWLHRHSAAATEPQTRRRNPAVDAAAAQPRKSSGSTTEARP